MELYKLKRTLLSVIYPNRCPFCGEIIGAGDFFHPDCPNLDFYDNKDEKSAFCCVYNDKSKTFIAKAKENADGYAVWAAAKFMFDVLMKKGVFTCLKNGGVDIILPIPARKAALKQRGYHFPSLLAEKLALLSGKKYSRNILSFSRETELQKVLTGERRERNLKEAFGLKKSLSGLNVLVVDDISATGATLNEAKRALSGFAENVYIAAFAKTVLK